MTDVDVKVNADVKVNMNRKVVAILPMRHESQRVVGKNYRLLGTKPLYAYILNTLLAVPEISDIIIDTNSPIILSSIKLLYSDNKKYCVYHGNKLFDICNEEWSDVASNNDSNSNGSYEELVCVGSDASRQSDDNAEIKDDNAEIKSYDNYDLNRKSDEVRVNRSMDIGLGEMKPKNIILLERPEDICAPDVSMNKILLSIVTRLPKHLKDVSDLVILQTHATNPFVEATTISNGIQTFLSKINQIDSLMTVTPFRKRLWIDPDTGANHNPHQLIQTQDLKPWYEENSCFYIFTKQSLLIYENRLGSINQFFEIPALQAYDIDTNDEFTMAESYQKLKDEHGENNESVGSVEGAVPKVHTDKYILTKLQEVFAKELAMAAKNENPFYGSSVLISAPYMMANIKAFTQFYNDLGVYVNVANVQERLNSEQVKEYKGLYDVALIGDDAFDELNVRECGAKALCKWGTGIDSIDLNACKRYGVAVENTPNAFSVPVAESVLASIFAFNRGLIESSNKMHYSNKWVKIPSKTMEEIVVGIVGMGNVGKTLAGKLYKLDCKTIFGYDVIKITPPKGVKMMENLYEMLDACDYVCICCDYNRINFHLVNTEFIHFMKKGSVLINMARGKLVDESALANGLLTGHLRGAALDVFEDEPLSETSVLRRLPNVLLNSHNANSSPLYWEKIHVNTIRNSLKYLVH